jgi:transposase
MAVIMRAMASSPSPGRPRYPSDVTDKQWTLIEPLLPPPNTDGRYEKHPRREIVNGIFYLLRTGCSWRQLPHDLPPWQTVYWYFKRWRDDGTVDRVHDALRDRLRDDMGRDPMVSAGIVDAQSVKGADTVGRASRGYDAGKRVNGRKRHVVVDTLGLLLVVMVTAASVQDRDGGKLVLQRLRLAMPSVATVFADGGYAGRLVAYARQTLAVVVELVRKPAEQQGFAVLPRRWVVERTLAWIVRCRRLDHDYERRIDTAEAMTKWAMIGVMTRRLAPGPGPRPWQPAATA